MAKIFLDTNIFINLVEKKGSHHQNLKNHKLFISTLSFHILMYVTKQKVPYQRMIDAINQFQLVPFDQSITYRALYNPTEDFEDNVQLQSAAEANCNLFLTEDRKLLNISDQKYLAAPHLWDSHP